MDAHDTDASRGESGPRPARASIADVAALVHIDSGKVREVFRLDTEHLLIVASDRISAFDVVLDETIPHKGQVLTGVSLHWFDLLDTPHHLVSSDVRSMDFLTDDQRAAYAGRAMLVRSADVIPMECVVRGYLYGSSWREYEAGGGPSTEHLPSGLQLASELPEPTFTPATKAESGHDENLTEADARRLVGTDVYDELRSRSLAIYELASARASERGIILADTKFEFGWSDGEIILIDEVLTPDSSRYWPAAAWEPGRVMPSFDKQPVRDWLDAQGDWDKTPPAPTMPPDIIQQTSDRYIRAFELITERPFTDYLDDVGGR